MSLPTSPIQVAETYFATMNREDWDSLAQLLHPEIEMIPTGSRPRTGREACITFFQRVFERFPVHDDHPTRFIHDGASTVVVEISFTGVSATGVDVTFDAVDVFDIDNGQIRRLTQWFDTAALNRLLSN